MDIRILDLDGSLPRQTQLLNHFQPESHDFRTWGPRIRMGCTFGQYRKFERALAESLDGEKLSRPALSLFGSGDFHHVSLALLRRLSGPFNLLVLDNHPDWMRGIPLMHCGTWLYHAARLPQVREIFHVGGHVDFDNGYRRLAPWAMLRSGKMTVFPGTSYFQGKSWKEVAHEPVRATPQTPVTARRLRELLYTHRATLKSCPLYISLDKDVLVAGEAPVNWDSGQLNLVEIEEILRAFVDAARGRLVGADIVGDWSPVRTQGLFRRFLHLTEHPKLVMDRKEANCRNERLNMSLIEFLAKMQAKAPIPTGVEPMAA